MTPKQTLRRRILEARGCLTAEDIATRSKAIHAHLEGLSEYKKARVVHLFVPFGTEVDTRPILRQLWERGTQTIVPRVAPQRQLHHLRITCWDDLEPGFRDIPEPVTSCAEIQPGRVDLVLVPGVAFDRDGGRLGYGGGYYDRFLDECPAPRVALAFALQVVNQVPQETHDLRVHRVVTEEGVITITDRSRDSSGPRS